MKKVKFTLLQSDMTEDILLIDGLCALCSKSGKFITRRKVKPLDLVEQNSEEGRELLERYGVNVDSVVLIRSEKAYIRSSAAIRCLLYMRWNWRWMYPLAGLSPLPIRDVAYRIIAKFRKKI